MQQRDPFVVVDYEVIQDERGSVYSKVTWKCSLCSKTFVMYDPPTDHKQECLVWLVNKV